MRRVHILSAFILVVLLPVPATAATVTVQVRNFEFSPAVAAGVAGDAVTWRKGAGTFHNVASVNAIFRSGSATSSAFTFTRKFSAGTYAYRCEVHPGQMTGRVRIRPRVAAAPSGLPFTVRWANKTTNTGRSFRVQYRVNNGSWRKWLGGTTKRAAIFGASNRPVKVVAGRTYRFRARSTRAGNTSGYSPPKTFTP